MTKFEQKCHEAAEKAMVEVDFIYYAGKKSAMYDDGYLLVRNGRGLQANFRLDDDVQDARKSRDIIMAYLGYPVTDACEIDDPEPDCCPHCGCDCGSW